MYPALCHEVTFTNTYLLMSPACDEHFNCSMYS